MKNHCSTLRCCRCKRPTKRKVNDDGDVKFWQQASSWCCGAKHWPSKQIFHTPTTPFLTSPKPTLHPKPTHTNPTRPYNSFWKIFVFIVASLGFWKIDTKMGTPITGVFGKYICNNCGVSVAMEVICCTLWW